MIGTFGMMAVGSTSTSAAYDAAAPTIVDERAIEIDRTLLSYERSHPTRLPLLKEVLRKVHIALSTSQRLSAAPSAATAFSSPTISGTGCAGCSPPNRCRAPSPVSPTFQRESLLRWERIRPSAKRLRSTWLSSRSKQA